jgi:hypothetical protein
MNGIKQIILGILVGIVAIGCRTNQTPDAARIHIQTSSNLVVWLDPERMPADVRDQDVSFFWAICDELVARREVDLLLAALNASKSDFAREWLVKDVLYRIDDRRVYDAFAQRLGDKEDAESYYVALYLAERGNTTALATLNRHDFQYSVSSFEWAGAVETFGKFRYMPAASNLVESLDAASLNVSAAACDALQEIFPDSPRHFSGPTEAGNYYMKRLGKVPKSAPRATTAGPGS